MAVRRHRDPCSLEGACQAPVVSLSFLIQGMTSVSPKLPSFIDNLCEFSPYPALK